MSIQDFGTIEANASLKQVINALADLQDTLNFLLNGNLDVKNIRASSITADRLKVTELSAIAADLGKVTAGILIGAYISTADGTYPRIDFSSIGNLLQAFTDANNYVSIIPNQSGQPTIEFKSGTSSRALFFSIPGQFALNSLVGDLSVNSQSGDLYLSANNILKLSGASLTINGFTGYSGTFSYVTDVVAGTPSYGSITVNNGIITSVV